jgi:uncharacterized protein YutE (UPF0331/DUF86 family)
MNNPEETVELKYLAKLRRKQKRLLHAFWKLDEKMTMAKFSLTAVNREIRRVDKILNRSKGSLGK